MIPIDVGEAEDRYGYEPSFSQTPELLFERHWGQTLMARALQKLRRTTDAASDEQLERHDRLLPYITGTGPQVPYGDAARELGTSTSAIKSSVHRLRKKYGRLLREEIAQTVADPGEIDDELRHLLAVVRPWAAAPT